MVARGVPHGSFGAGPPPGQDRGAVDDDIPSPDEAGRARAVHQHDEEQLVQRRPGPLGALALLGRTGHAHAAPRVSRQPAGQGEGRPGHQPIMHILIGQAPQRLRLRDEQPRLLRVDLRVPAGSRRQWWRAVAPGEPRGQPAQREQMQPGDERERVDAQAGPTFT